MRLKAQQRKQVSIVAVNQRNPPASSTAAETHLCKEIDFNVLRPVTSPTAEQESNLLQCAALRRVGTQKCGLTYTLALTGHR